MFARINQALLAHVASSKDANFDPAANDSFTPPHAPTTPLGSSRAIDTIMPLELWDRVLDCCDERSFAAMLNVCRGMRLVPSNRTMRTKMELVNKRQLCPDLPRDTLAARYIRQAAAHRHLERLTQQGPLLLQSGSNMRYAHFSNDGRFAVVEITEPWCVRLFDFRGDTPIGHTLVSHDRLSIGAVDFSPDGAHVFIASSERCEGPHTSHIYDVRGDTPTLVAALESISRINAAAYSPDARMLATGTTVGHVCLWDLSCDVPTVTHLQGIDDYVHGLEFSPDGARLVVNGLCLDPAHQSRACVWDVRRKNPQPTHSIPQETWIAAARWSPDGNHLALISSEPRAIRVVELRDDDVFPSELTAHAWWVDKRRALPTDFYVGVRDNFINVHDITKRPAQPFDVHASHDYVFTSNVSADARFVVTKDPNKQHQICLYDVFAKPPQAAAVNASTWSMLLGLMRS